MKGKTKLEKGQRVLFSLEGPIEELTKDFVYVRVVVQSGEHHVHGRVVLYRHEVRPLKSTPSPRRRRAERKSK